jgi:hypothetical protein
MDSFLENVGILAIAFVIIYAYKKVQEYYKFKYLDIYEDKKIYMAADAFSHGAASEDVISLLTSCFEFEKEDADEILKRSLPHRTDKDGGYREFIKSVNKVLGIDVYSQQYRNNK